MPKLILIALSSLLATSAAAACCDAELKDPSASVRVLQPIIKVQRHDAGLVVTVLGELENTTEATVDDLVVEARIADANGQVADVLTQSLYGIVVPPGQRVAFRLQAPAASPEASYSSVKARVTSGEGHRPSPRGSDGKDRESALLSFLVSWGPMLLLILVWVVLARKYSGKGSPQQRLVELMVEQNALLARQASAIESIVSTGNSPRAPREA